MSFRYAISAIEFSSGSRSELPPAGVTLLVGANNVGKSRCLKEVATLIGAGDGSRLVVTRAIEELREGTTDDFYDWLKYKYRLSSGHGNEGLQAIGSYSVTTGGKLIDMVRSIWEHQRPGLGTLGRVVATHLDTGRRLTEANSTSSYDAINSVPDVALQALYADEQLEAKLSSNFRKAFGTDLVVDRQGGSTIALRCGPKPDEVSLGGLYSPPFGRAVRELPVLDEQGDGMRSYVACLLQTDVLQRPIVLIDEPEAFLHPPQARILGQHLAAAAKHEKRQIIVATHSSDVVRGALDGGGADVCVVRISRNEAGNVAQQLDAAAVKNLWKDPLLRASHLLDALFHKHLVLCEGEGDCQFYNATLEAICDDRGLPRPDVMFAHTNGKDKLPAATSAIAAIGVPITVIADIDILSNEWPLRGIWEGLGGQWGEIEGLQRRVSASVTSSVRKPERNRVREQVIRILDSDTSDKLDNKTIEGLRELLRTEGGWSSVKRTGLSGIPKGDARGAAETLLKALARRGLHVVPEGELEGFLPQIGGHGPPWVAEALKLDLAHDNDAAHARNFIEGLGLLRLPMLQ